MTWSISRIFHRNRADAEDDALEGLREAHQRKEIALQYFEKAERQAATLGEMDRQNGYSAGLTRAMQRRAGT